MEIHHPNINISITLDPFKESTVINITVIPFSYTQVPVNVIYLPQRSAIPSQYNTRITQ